MNPQSIKQTLLDQKAELTTRLKSIEADMEKGRSRDAEDQAQERENDEVLEGISVEAREELRRIDRALEKIDDQTYGQCDSCGKAIDERRLQALPYAELCIECA